VRWGAEAFYGGRKIRLDLENFTGLTVEAVRPPNFHASVYRTGLESVLAAADPIDRGLPPGELSSAPDPRLEPSLARLPSAAEKVMLSDRIVRRWQ
jgi:hypothetical protein